MQPFKHDINTRFKLLDNFKSDVFVRFKLCLFNLLVLKFVWKMSWNLFIFVLGHFLYGVALIWDDWLKPWNAISASWGITRDFWLYKSDLSMLHKMFNSSRQYNYNISLSIHIIKKLFTKKVQSISKNETLWHYIIFTIN